MGGGTPAGLKLSGAGSGESSIPKERIWNIIRSHSLPDFKAVDRAGDEGDPDRFRKSALPD